MNEYAGEDAFFPAVVPITCPVGMVWDEHTRRCAPVVLAPPPPIVPILAGYYTGAPIPGSPQEWHDIEPDLFGVDATLKGCGAGMYWDGYFKKCMRMHVPLGPAPVPTATGYFTGQEWHDVQPDLFGVDAILKGCGQGMYWDGWFRACKPTHTRVTPPDPFPPTLGEWERLHGAHRTGFNIGDIFDPFQQAQDIGRALEHHDDHHWHEHHEHEHHEHPWHEHHEHEHFVGRAWVGAAVAEGHPVATAAVHAENADVQAKSAQAAASHPSADGTSASKSAQAATSHAALAASHAQSAAAHPSPEISAVHAQKAVAHAQQAASHAADAHAAIGNAGAGAGAQHPTGAHPASQAAAHAQNAATQARSAQVAASHPSASGTQAPRYAQAASSHASQAAFHAQAARSGGPNAGYHAQQAAMHTQAAASHAVNAHAALQGRPVIQASAERGFGRSVDMGRAVDLGRRGAVRRPGMGRGFPRADRFGRRLGGYRDTSGRFHGRRFFGEWRGAGHPGWLHGVGARWLHHRATCWRRLSWGCGVEQIFEPGGNFGYRVTPAGLMEGVELEPQEQAANVRYVQVVGQAVPTADDGPMPGSDPSSSGAQAPADEDESAADQAATSTDAADQTAQAADQTTSAADQSSDQSTSDDSGSDAGDDSTATSGEYAGWQDPFTTPYPGFFNPYMPAAWDSRFTYPGFGYDPYSGYWGRRYW